MTFEVNGRQYVAIASGPSPGSQSKLVLTPKLKEQRNATVLYVFAARLSVSHPVERLPRSVLRSGQGVG